MLIPDPESYAGFSEERMEEMIARWIRETIAEFNLAKENGNLFKMHQMKALLDGLKDLREKLTQFQ